MAGEYHFHLLGGAVLGFVENDEGVVKGTTPHEGEGGYFDDSAFDELFHLFGFEHIVDCIVEGAEVGIDLFFEGSGEEAEFFSGFDGGACQDDPGDALCDEGGDGHGDGKVSFAGAGGSDAENEVIALDCLEVSTLIDRLWGENLFAEVSLAAAGNEGAEGDGGISSDNPEVTC